MTDDWVCTMSHKRTDFAPKSSKPLLPPRAAKKNHDSDRDLFATPILVVEDESMIAWMLENVLLDAGFTTVELASTGEDAEQIAATDRPELIISDVNLGRGKDGIAAARAIRAAHGPVPLIFVTAYADDAIRERLAAELPGAQLLRKPVDEATLVRAVMRALAN